MDFSKLYMEQHSGLETHKQSILYRLETRQMRHYKGQAKIIAMYKKV